MSRFWAQDALISGGLRDFNKKNKNKNDLPKNFKNPENNQKIPLELLDCPKNKDIKEIYLIIDYQFLQKIKMILFKHCKILLI